MHRLLFTLGMMWLLTSLPASAQITLQTPEQLSALEKAGYDAAMRWTFRHNFPAAIRLDNGSTLGIIRTEGPYPVYFTTHNDAAARFTNTTPLHVGVAGLLIQGNTMEMGIWDEGAVYDSHQELDGRILTEDKDNISNHATHVAGTLIAAGKDPAARGMAPGARLRSFNWNFHATEMRLAANDGLLLSNHSYGRVGGWHSVNNGSGSKTWYWFGNPAVSESEDYTFGYYDRDAYLFDHAAYQNPYYLPIVSAGNERDDQGPVTGSYKALDTSGRWIDYDITTRPIQADGGQDGYDSITSMALAKNVLTVGSVGPTANGDVFLSTFSSAGPTDDGRIKPDLVGIGENVYSSIAAGPSAYAHSSGTSMAAPNVAGSLLLLQEMARQLNNKTLRAATLKGLVLHTATDLGPPGPDYQFGWGMLNTRAAAELIDDAFRQGGLIQENELAPAQVWEEQLSKPDEGPLRITLSWTDVPGPSPDTGQLLALNDRTPMLINDLDLVLEHVQTGEQYLPYLTDPETPALPAITGDNIVDPIEQIYLDAAPAGDYLVRIAHKGNLAGNEPQAFSLLMSGIEQTRRTVVMQTAYAEASIGDVTLLWETDQENMPGRFIIERSGGAEAQTAINAPLAVQFTPVNAIPTRGISGNGAVYTFADSVFLSGQYTYRVLFESDQAATRLLLSEVSVDVPAPSTFSIQSIFPNPTPAQSQLVLDVPAAAVIKYAAFDLLGRQVTQTTTVSLTAGRHFIPVDATVWAPGIYFIRVSTEHQHLVQKLIVL